MPLAVYAAEREAGLAEMIRSTGRIAYASLLEVAEPSSLPEQMVARLRATVDEPRNFDLYHSQSILATVGWNKNDDVFDKSETWSARNTPVDKPFNWEHNQGDIVGHITASFGVDEKLTVIAEESVIDDLPDKFHVYNREVLYCCWEDPDKQKRINDAIAEIAKGLWYVSMEALFQNFDYGLLDSQGKGRVVARNEETAFLTKHLRAYGGKGIYNGQKVGRVLRNFTFSGKGLVRKPANPESIIITDSKTFKANSKEEINIFSSLGYENSTDQEKQMTEIDILKKQLADLMAEKETLKAELRETDTKALKTRAEDLAADLKSKTDELEALKTQAGEIGKELTASKTDLESLKGEFKTIAEKLAKLESEQKIAQRVSSLVKALEMTEEKAIEMVEKMASLDDVAFAANTSYMAEKLADYKKASPTIVRQEVPPTATETKPEVKPIPKATSAPAPASGPVKKVKEIDGGGKAPPISPANPLPENGHEEFDEATANVTDVENLETAQPVPEPALATVETTPGVEKVRASIAELMGEYLGAKTSKK